MPARKVHYTYVDPSLTIPVCCDSTSRWKESLPERQPTTSTDPRHVTCLRCLRTMARLTREARHGGGRGPAGAGAGRRWRSRSGESSKGSGQFRARHEHGIARYP
jgi:hypothetical protein